MKIGIIGLGFVGTAVYEKFKNFYTVFKYDIIENKSNCLLDELIKKSKIIFVCLPTPMNDDGSCNIDKVESVLKTINNHNEKRIITLYLGKLTK